MCCLLLLLCSVVAVVFSPPKNQANIYSPDCSFFSFKQVVRELNSNCLLVSLHSTSKVGCQGEGGQGQEEQRGDAV